MSTPGIIIMTNNGSSGTSSNLANYGGKVADTTAYIKQFTSSSSTVAWIYKTINGTKYITPSTKNDVYFPVNATVEKNLTVNGLIINPSDISLKENINILTNNFCDNILKIVPKKYTFKTDENKKERYGVIAQELEEYFPELVINTETSDNSKNFKSVNYLELIPIIIGKMKTMQSEIDELKQTIKHLHFPTE
jgi:hypothetical protein